MLDVSESQLSKYIIHYVADTLLTGEEVYPQPEMMLEAAFTQLAFHKIDFEQPYEFFHETDLRIKRNIYLCEINF